MNFKKSKVIWKNIENSINCIYKELRQIVGIESLKINHKKIIMTAEPKNLLIGIG